MQEIIQATVFFLAGGLHGVTGMGFPLLATAVLALVMPMPKVVALVALPSFLLSLLVIIKAPAGTLGGIKVLAKEFSYYAKTYKHLAIASVVGSITGVWLLSVLPMAWLLLLMAMVTLYYAISGLLALFGKAKPIYIAQNAQNSVIFGFLAGLVGGATNAMSPILLMVLLSETDDKNRIAKASNLCYLLAKIVQMLMLKEQYLRFGIKEYGFMGLLTLCCVVGLFFGIRLRDKITPNAFKSLIFIVLLILALKIGHLGLTTLVW